MHPRPLIAVLLLTLLATITGGCQATGGTERGFAELVDRNELGIRISSRLATTIAISSIDGPQELADTATYVRTVAVAVQEATSEGTISMDQVRALAERRLDAEDLNPMQRAAVGEVLLAVADLIEAVLDRQFSNAPEGTYLYATRVLLNSAASGVREACDRAIERSEA